jgi:hypothetical protein
MWTAMAFIVLLFFLSIYGAFIGPQRAKHFFNTIPLGIYWFAFVLLLAISIVLFKRLLRVPALLLIHTGCIFVLAGAIYGSEAGHKINKKLFGIDKIPSGRMQIYEGHSDNRVLLANNEIRELPFDIALKDFRLEHYKPEYLYIQSSQGDYWRCPVEIGAEYFLGPELGSIKIVRTFENFRITIDGENRTIVDAPDSGYNPALEVQIKSPDGQIKTRYVFERLPGHTYSEDEFSMSYRRIISEFISELQVIRDGEVVAAKEIQVNHPLKYGGYHFYQYDYDHQNGRFTILEVTSDSGLSVVYAGYLMLCIGLCWHFWITKLFNRTAGATSKNE